MTELKLDDRIILPLDTYQNLNHEQKIKVNRCINILNEVVEELNSEDNTVHMHNVSSDLIRSINRYNRTHPFDHINPTQIWVDSLHEVLLLKEEQFDVDGVEEMEYDE